jgi:hypothetical protein
VWFRRPLPDRAGAVKGYQAFVESQVAQERALKASLESRGITVITTATSLATLAFGVSAAGSALKTLTLSFWSIALIFLGVLGLLLAAIVALRTNTPRAYIEGQPSEVKDLLTRYKRWTPAEMDAARQVTLLEIDIWSGAVDQNEEKATRLAQAIVLEIAGVVLLFAAALIILVTSAATPGSTVAPSPSPSVSP